MGPLNHSSSRKANIFYLKENYNKEMRGNAQQGRHQADQHKIIIYEYIIPDHTQTCIIIHVII